MHIRRGLLFGGLFFITVGGIELLVRAGTIDANRLDEAWKLWPLILVGIGIAILLGRSRVEDRRDDHRGDHGRGHRRWGDRVGRRLDRDDHRLRRQPADRPDDVRGRRFLRAIDRRPVDPLRHADLRHGLRCGLDLRRRLSRARTRPRGHREHARHQGPRRDRRPPSGLDGLGRDADAVRAEGPAQCRVGHDRALGRQADGLRPADQCRRRHRRRDRRLDPWARRPGQRGPGADHARRRYERRTAGQRGFDRAVPAEGRERAARRRGPD